MQSYAFLINNIAFKELNVMKQSCLRATSRVSMCLFRRIYVSLMSSTSNANRIDIERKPHRHRTQTASTAFGERLHILSYLGIYPLLIREIPFAYTRQKPNFANVKE